MPTYHIGQLQMPRASRTLVCRRKERCELGRLIDKGEFYLNVINIKPDEGKKKVYYRRFHLECVYPWLQYLAERRKEYLANKPPPAGRPEGVGQLAVLSPAQKKYRSYLIRRRLYLIQKIIKAKPESLQELQLVQEVHDLVKQINGTGITRMKSMGRGGHDQELSEANNRHTCTRSDKTPYHSLGEDYHCTDCNQCYSASHKLFHSCLILES